MQEQIERDLKAALLAGDRQKVETLKTLKSALLYEAVNKSLDRNQMTDEQIQLVLSREAKKRQEAADMYAQGGADERRDKELAEKAIIDSYLPKQMEESELIELVEAEIQKIDNPTVKDMGRIIGAVKAQTGPAADGSLVAKLVKEKLSQ